MDIFRSLTDLPVFDASVLTIGTFDGVHQGHTAIFQETVSLAHSKGVVSAAVTFDPHPQHVTKQPGENAKILITGIRRKCMQIDANGIDYLLVIPFDEAFSRMTASTFLESVLIKHFHPTDIVVGYDHHFGHNRKGDADFLANQSEMHDYRLHVLEPVEDGSEVVSSTRIRELILNHEIEKANGMLGWNFEIRGTVTKGAGRGRSLGFPTANVVPEHPSHLIPPNGVYCVQVHLENDILPGICNIGNRPTFGDNLLRQIEVHILDDENFSLLEQKVIIVFRSYLRKEVKFDNTKRLIKKISDDRNHCLEWLKRKR